MKKIVLTLAALGIAFYFGKSFFAKSLPEAYVTPAVRGTAINAVTGNVKVLPELEMNITAQAGGKVLETAVIPGSGILPVKKGDVVLQLDTAEVEDELKQLQMRLKFIQERKQIGSNLEIDHKNLSEDLTFYEKLNASGSFSNSELERKKRDYERLSKNTAHEKLNQDFEEEMLLIEIQKKEKLIEKMTIRAPMDGNLTAINFLPEMFVHNGSNVGKIITDNRLIEVSVSEEDYLGIDLNQEVNISLLGDPHKLHAGLVSMLSPTADSNTKRRTIFVSLSNPSPSIIPGMTGNASIVKSKRDNTLLIPRRALVGSHVYTLEKNKVRLRQVTPGFQGIDYAEVLDNLNEGELVITDNVFSFRENERVKPCVNAG